MHSKLKGLIWIGLVAAGVGAVVWGIPRTAKSIPWSTEKKIAEKLGDPEGLRVCKNTASGEELQKIVKRLFPLFPDDAFMPLQIQVVHGKIVNAFASLGGKIYVYDGLLQKAESPEEIAGVLAHEIEHLHHRHIMESIFLRLITLVGLNAVVGGDGTMDPRLLNLLLNLKFGREQEMEADEDGLKRLKAAKIDVRGFQQFFERSENQTLVPSLLSDHPPPENRAALVRQYLGNPSEPLLDAKEWTKLKKICED